MLGAALVPFCDNCTALEGSEIAAGNVGDRMLEVRPRAISWLCSEPLRDSLSTASRIAARHEVAVSGIIIFVPAASTCRQNRVTLRLP
jgi:hypothetical protein